MRFDLIYYIKLLAHLTPLNPNDYFIIHRTKFLLSGLNLFTYLTSYMVQQIILLFSKYQCLQ